jgi:hypothetical protein
MVTLTLYGRACIIQYTNMSGLPFSKLLVLLEKNVEYTPVLTYPDRVSPLNTIIYGVWTDNKKHVNVYFKCTVF